MKSFLEYINSPVLNESYKNLFLDKKDERRKYVDEVWEILQKSYEKIGGIKGSGFGSKEDMIEKLPFWKLYIKGGKVIMCAFYKDKGGRKMVALGSDGSADGKHQVYNFLLDELRTKRS